MITWRKLKHPTVWRPSVPGDELIGYYIGQSPRKGAFGEYTVALIATPTGDGTVGVPRIVSGTALLNALDGAMVQVGTMIRVVYGGLRDLGEGRTMKLFDVYATDSAKLTAEDLVTLGAVSAPPDN